MSWETVIGLEVHVQLATQSKLFCDCSTAFGDDPNTNVCPVCLGLPGALPVTNREAVRLGVRTALALGFAVHSTSVFARKNYFYPDLPKGYQISQFDQPLATNGALEIESADRGEVSIGLTRLHLEEDAGKSLHDRFPGQTALDFNRSGVPLAEIVSDPDLRSPAEARAYLTSLKQILLYLEVSDCSMEEGRLRVDANVSVRREGQTALGMKQEIKNMNSFAAVERSLDRLRLLQIQTLEDGATVEPNTFSAATGNLRVMRTKEASHDYRYFSEPDLPPLEIGPNWVDEERKNLPELPRALCARIGHQYGIPSYDARVLASTRALADYFEQVAGAGVDGRTAAHWVMGSVLQDANENGGVLRVAPTRLAALIHMVGNRQVSLQTAKRLFPELAVSDEAPETLVARLGVNQVDDEDQLSEWVRTVIEAYPDEVSRFGEEESKLMSFFMGRVMKMSRGKADPKRVRQMLLAELER